MNNSEIQKTLKLHPLPLQTIKGYFPPSLATVLLYLLQQNLFPFTLQHVIIFQRSSCVFHKTVQAIQSFYQKSACWSISLSIYIVGEEFALHTWTPCSKNHPALLLAEDLFISSCSVMLHIFESHWDCSRQSCLSFKMYYKGFFIFFPPSARILFKNIWEVWKVSFVICFKVFCG